MIKNKKQMIFVITVFTLILALGGTTYAWFNYRRESTNQELMAGNIYMHLNEGNNQITLTNVFPETKEEARAKNDNYITFNIEGINESSKTIYYEFILNHGDDKESPKSRYRDQDLRFDLEELDSNGDFVKYILSDVSYDTLINKRIWIDTIDANTTTEIVKKYKLRMWLSDDVIISDSDPNRTYTAAEYPNKYATIKLTAFGDFTEKLFGYQKVKKAITAKQNAETNSCNPTWTDTEDGIVYFSGTNDCVDMNYVWYSGKLWRITSIYPDGTMKLITQNNNTSIAFNEPEQIDFYTDANTKSYMYQWLNEDFYDTLYNANRFIDTSKEWNATKPADTNVSTKPAETNMVTANVGLLNNYEYYNSFRCVESEGCNSLNWSTGYLNIGYYWWLLNPYSASGVWCVDQRGIPSSNAPTASYGSRPSIYLKSGLEFTGEGTLTSPYKIVGDKDTGQVNALINTRLSGEYIKLKNGNNEQLFRIIGVEDNKTKIIAMDYAENRNTRSFIADDQNEIVLWGSGKTTDTDTWYEFLNRQTTGYFDTLKSIYGQLFDSGLYYLGSTIYNYKLGICANTTSGNTKVCDKTNYNGTFNIGLPRYGEMFATQQAGGYSKSINMWLINRYSESIYWCLSQKGNSYFYDPLFAFGARPTVHLKSTIKILSGSGTESDPYVVGL